MRCATWFSVKLVLCRWYESFVVFAKKVDIPLKIQCLKRNIMNFVSGVVWKIDEIILQTVDHHLLLICLLRKQFSFFFFVEHLFILNIFTFACVIFYVFYMFLFLYNMLFPLNLIIRRTFLKQSKYWRIILTIYIYNSIELVFCLINLLFFFLYDIVAIKHKRTNKNKTQLKIDNLNRNFFLDCWARHTDYEGNKFDKIILNLIWVLKLKRNEILNFVDNIE